MDEEKFVDCNPATLEMFGCEREEIIGATPFKFSPPKQPDGQNSKKKGKKKLKAAFQGEEQCFEWLHIKKDGTPFEVEVRLNRIEIGDKYYLQALVRDITQRKKAIRTLKESENKFKALAEESLVGVYLIQNNTFQYVNPKFAQILGYSKKELIGNKKPKQVVPPDEQDKMEKHLEKRFSGDAPQSQFELTVLTKEGHKREVEIFGSRIEYNGAPALIGTMVDITDKKKARQLKQKQHALQASERKLRSILNNIELIVLSFNPKGEVTFINDHGEKLIGWNRNEIIGRSWFNYMVTGDRKQEAKVRMNEIFGEESKINYRFTNTIVTKEGRRETIKWHSTVITDEEGNRVGLNSIGEVVTEKQQAQQTIERLFKFTLNPLCIASTDGYLKKVNPAFEKTLGYSQEKLTSIPFINFVHPDDRKKTREALGKLQQGGVVDSFENRYINKDGSITWFLWQAIPGTKSDIIYASATDITHIKNVEQELNFSRQQFKSLFNHAAVGMAKVSLEGRFLKVNDTLCDILGYKSEAIINRHFNDFTYPDDRAKSNKLKEGLIRGNFNYKSMEKRYVRKDGNIIVVRLTVKMVKDRAGEPSHFVSVFEDITARSEAEKKVEETNSLLKATFEATADGVLAVDNEGNIITYNQRFADLWGIPEDILKHKDDEKALEYVIPNLAKPDEFIDRIRYLYNNPEKDSHDIIKLKDGRVFEQYSHPQYIDGEIVGRVWNFRDITSRHKAQKALQKSEANLQAIFNNSAQGFILMNTDGVVQAVNKKARKLHKNIVGGHLAEQSSIDECLKLAPDSYREDFEEALNNVLTQGERHSTVFYTNEHWLSADLNPVYEQDKITGVSISFLDVTEEKNAVDALTKSEQRYRALVQNSSDLVTIVDQDGRIQYVNPSITRVLNFEKDDLLKEDFFTLVHKEDRPAAKTLFKKLKTQKSIETPIEFRFLTKEGASRYLELVGTNLSEDPSIEGIVFNCREVTDRKLALETLRENEARFRTMVENVPGIIYRCDYDEHWTMHFISDRIEAVSGYTPKDLIHNNNRSFASLIHPEDVKMVQSVVTQQVEQGKAFEVEYRIIHREGNIKWVYEKGQAVRGEDNQILYLDGAILDITEDKKAEQIRETTYKIASAANQITDRDEFFSYIHHELDSVINTNNFYIALYDDDQHTLSFPYFVDKYQDNSNTTPPERSFGHGLTEYLLSKGQPMLLNDKGSRKRRKKGTT
jgi:PAS domain S-box-containing protein